MPRSDCPACFAGSPLTSQVHSELPSLDGWSAMHWQAFFDERTAIVLCGDEPDDLLLLQSRTDIHGHAWLHSVLADMASGARGGSIPELPASASRGEGAVGALLMASAKGQDPCSVANLLKTIADKVSGNCC